MRFVNFTIISKNLNEFCRKTLLLAAVCFCSYTSDAGTSPGKTYFRPKLTSNKSGLSAFSNTAHVMTGGNNALSIDGAGDYANLGAQLPAGSSYTKEAWVYLPDPAKPNNIISSYHSPFWIDGRLRASNQGSTYEIRDTQDFPANTWVHVAVTYDAVAGEFKLYRNGVLVAQVGGADAYDGENIYIGAWYNGSVVGSNMSGKLDEVRIWNKVRTAEEIKQGMCGNVPTNSSGLVSYYAMNEGSGSTLINSSTSADAVGLGAPLSGNPVWVLSPVQHATNALLFDGTNTYVKVPHISQYDFTTGTIECWVRQAVGATGYNAIIASYEVGTRFCLYLSETSIGLSNGSVFKSLSFTAAPDTWYHFAFVFSPGSTDVYVNGSYYGNFASGMGAVTGLPLYIGYSNAGNPFNGAIDEVRIWNVARTEAEIQAAMNSTIATPQPGLVAAFNFDQGLPAGDNTGLITIIDATENNNHGTLNNFTLTGSTANYIANTMNLFPLPVNILSFTAHPSDDKVILDWTTASEQNNKHFEVERSSDGAVFYRIGTVQGAGNRNTASHYRFTDQWPVKGTNYYRLKQVDIDGKSSYSSIQRVQIAGKGFSYTIRQNPVAGELPLNIELEKAATVRLEIRDVNGSLLIKNEQWFDAGVTLYGLSVAGLANGTYIVNVITGKGNDAKMFVKQ